MRIPAFLVCASLIISSARSEPLSSADREALLESLDKIQENADSKVDARFRAAIAAYREAMTTDEAALDFYLKCIEKVDFQDQQKKYVDFREWKRKEADKLGDQGFRLALRYQLRWLALTLRAASQKARVNDLAVEAQEIVDSLFRDADRLKSQGQVLDQSVISTVFAKAYEIGNLEKDDWPLSPVQLDAIYDGIIFPIFRSPSRIESLRAAWNRRIQQEGIKIESIIGGGKVRKNGQPAPNGGDNERFMNEIVPQLQWQMEIDLFRNGDEAGAAERMLGHIEKHLTHKSALDWAKQLKSMLAPKPAPAQVEAKAGA